MTRLTKDVKKYVQLVQSVGLQGKGSSQLRPLTPVECARRIKQLIDEESENLSKISERLGLGKPKDGSGLYKKRDITQVTHFLNLLKVSEKSRNIAGWGYEKFPKIPFSLVAELSTLEYDEQDMILQSVYNTNNKRTINRLDVINIKKWRNENKDLSIDVCIEKVLKLKPVKIINHIIVCEIREKLKKFILSNNDHANKILDILGKNLDGSFFKLDATDILITISMDEIAYKIFHEHQYKKDISFTKFLNDFLEDKIA